MSVGQYARYPVQGGGSRKVTVPFGLVQAASTTTHLSLFTLPAGALLNWLVIKHTQAFSGGSISDVIAQLGIASFYSQFISDFDVNQAVADQAFSNVLANFIGSWSSATAIYLTLLSTGANLSALTQGSLYVDYSYTQL